MSGRRTTAEAFEAFVLAAGALSRQRGHRLGYWRFEGPMIALAQCSRCDRWAQINVEPGENPVTGGALRTSCGGPSDTAWGV